MNQNANSECKITCSSTRGIESHDGLYSDIETRNIEGLKHYLEHALSVEFWIQWSFGQQNRKVLGLDTELIVGIGPNLQQNKKPYPGNLIFVQ